MEELQPRPVRLAWDRSHGEPLETITFPMASAAPPSPMGAGEQSADATAAVGGGADGGFSLADGELSGWDLLVVPNGSCSAPSDLQELVEALAAGPEFRSAALLRAMERFRDVLDQLPVHTALDATVQVSAGDLLVLTRALLQRLR
jgi:hypothetical protein